MKRIISIIVAFALMFSCNISFAVNDENILVGKSITSGSSVKDIDISMLNDGNQSTYTEFTVEENNVNSYIAIDLCEYCAINEIRINGEIPNNSIKTEFSTDELFTVTYIATDDEITKLDNGLFVKPNAYSKYRYIKISFAGNNPSSGKIRINEIEIYKRQEKERSIVKQLYISPNGNDNNDGSEAHPFATIGKARDEVRKYLADMSGDIKINIADGVYIQNETLIFDDRDSGQNGYNVIYSAQNGTPVISGGKKVTGWTRESGNIWSAKIPMDYVDDLYVNGHAAIIAGASEDIPIERFFDSPETNQSVDGIVVKKSNLPQSVVENADTLLFRSIQGWTNYEWHSEQIKEINADEYAIIMDRGFTWCLGGQNPLREGSSLFAAGSKAFLDAPGEFCYNKAEEKLYYIPLAGENMNSAEAYIPVIEELVRVQGRDLLNKAHNIVFEGLTFAHTRWNYVYECGMGCIQASLGGDETSLAYTNPSSVIVSEADSITFRNNSFTGMSMIALGLWEGVTNSVVDGNCFYDLKNGSITMGPWHHNLISDTDEYYDVAYLKPCTASSYVTSTNDFSKTDQFKYGEYGLRPASATDKYISSFWCPTNADPQPYIQVDLQEMSKYDEICAYTRLRPDDNYDWRNYPSGIVDPANIKVWVSDKEDFSEYDEIPFNSSEDFIRIPDDAGTINNGYTVRKLTFSNGETLNKRFIRLSSPFGIMLEKLSANDKSRVGIPHEQLCANDIISNNYFTRVAYNYWSRSVITSYFAQNITINNNYIVDCPYTGISVGWGYRRTTTTGGGYKVLNNFIDGAMLKGVDGAPIFTIGINKNSHIIGNYVKNQYHSYAAIYLDWSSRGFTVSDNVSENVPRNLLVNGLSGVPYPVADCNVKNTYSSTSKTLIRTHSEAENVSVEDVKLFMLNRPSAAAKMIMDKSGLQKEYRNIINKVPKNNPDFLEMCGIKRNQWKTVTENQPDYMSYKSYIFVHYLDNMKDYLSFAEKNIGDGLGQFSDLNVKEFRNAVRCATSAYNESNVSDSELVEIYDTLTRAKNKLFESRNKISYEEMLIKVKQALSNAEPGQSMGCYPKEAIDNLKEFLNSLGTEYEYNKSGDKYLELEQEYFSFKDTEITLSITNAYIKGQTRPAEINEVANTVTLYMPTGTLLNNIVPEFTVSDGCYITKQTASITDYSKENTIVVKDNNNLSSRFWTVRVVLE